MRFSRQFFKEYLNNKKYFSYRFINKKSNTLLKSEQYSIDCSNIGILIQGPIIENDDFTINTLLQYREYYPNINIYFSTWDMGVKNKNKIIGKNIVIIENDKLINPGPFNINLQIKTTANGIKKAKADGCKFILKTRSDQRLNHPGFIAYFMNLLKIFPAFKESNINYRLICSSMNTLKFRYYGVSDMLMFGESGDMCDYWNVKYDDRDNIDFNFATQNLKNYSLSRLAEVYLCTEFLKKRGEVLSYTLNQYLKILGKYFIVIDSESLLLYWNKYTCNIDRYSKKLAIEPQITFQDWLLIYTDSLCGTQKFYLSEDSMLDKGI